MGRRSKGRQKLEMVKISNESNLLVTFSKRRAGLFKKASELSTLCGAELALIIFSPGRKAFSYGHPSVEAVVDRYLTGSYPQTTSSALQHIEAHRNARHRQLNLQLTQVLNELEMERKRGEDYVKSRKMSKFQRWWEAPIEELDLAQLGQLRTSMLELRQNVAKQAEQLLIQSANDPQIFPPPTPAACGLLPFDPKDLAFNEFVMPNYRFNHGSGCGF